jgi:folylpolyglutamate synthase/dihydropteroate synthase
LLKPLAELHRELPFSVVIFTTNKVNSIESVDLINNMAKPDPDVSSQQAMATVWSDLTRGFDNLDLVIPIITKTADESLDYTKDCDSILVCGSLHLVGAMMSIIKVPVT